MKNIVVFASGSGTNAENIIRFFESSNFAKVTCVISNRADAYVLVRAKKLNVNIKYLNKDAFYNTNEAFDFITALNPDLIVLAGFLLLVPSNIISTFPKRIINIHPALLPKYGGKGMYGDKVHNAVIENKEHESGITIHYVNEKYDEGDIIFQKSCPVFADDNAESLAKRIHQLEYEFFPKVIQMVLEKSCSMES